MLQRLLSRASSFWSPPKLYSDVCESHGPAYYDYESLRVSYGDSSAYTKESQLGSGKYSEVFLGRETATNRKVVIKVLKPIRLNKIQREIAVLKAVRGGPNVTTLIDVVKDRGTAQPTLVMDYTDNQDFRQLYPTLSDFDIRYYIYELLKAVDFTHSRGIMHRDIKPLNVMIDHPHRKLRLIDWGMAEFYLPGKEYHVRVASRYFKAPEFLAGNSKYDYACDVWSLAAMFAGLIFRQEPFFHGCDLNDQLVKIARVVGTDGLHQYVKRYGLTLDAQLMDGTLGYFPARPLIRYRTKENSALANDSAIDLLAKMLVYDPPQRISPQDALKHAYFSPVREMWDHLNRKIAIEPSSPSFSTAEAILSQLQQ